MTDDSPPEALPLRMAITAFSSEAWRENARLYLKTQEEFGTASSDVRRLLWLDLRSRHRNKEVVLTGRLWGSAETILIPHDFLEEQEPDYDRNQVESGGVTYTNVHVSLAPSTGQAAPAASNPPPPKTFVSEADLVRWYLDYVKSVPEDQRCSLQENYEAAKRWFSDAYVSRGRVERVRATHAPDHWKTSGRPKKVSPEKSPGK